MNRKQLSKLKRELTDKRKSPYGIKSQVLIGIAKRLGRELCDRGSEPNYVRKVDPALSPPLSIPNHSVDLKPNTARSIIDQLLDDVDEWEIYFNESDSEDNNEEDGDE